MNNAIEIRGLVKRFPAFTLGPIDITVPKGAIYGLIGPNGAGKTTTIDLLFGIGKNDAGTIRIFNYDHAKQEVEMKLHTAYVSPILNFNVWKTIGKLLRFVRGFYPTWDDAYCAKLMGIFELSPQMPIQTLSFGSKTRLSVLLALSRRPDVLVLDEPTTGLDAVSKQQVFAELLKTVEDGEHSVLISSHALSDIERFADHVGMIKNGKMLFEARMDEIADRYRFAEFSVSNTSAFEKREGLTITRKVDNRIFALLDLRRTTQDWLQTNGAQQLSLTRVTLEDVFITLAKEKEAPCAA